ncbi:hypothetical protein BO71DRAFT_117680 [Aspergillus ellipticus CBS 707.79]|uniref:Uncharacterized protein n=1 Tax=Aspergillus ellipticus CBS 707.79 TaxID=1448320 RepID=A0A319DDL5_9EURO|nr:hypothetical protein BO71DRAFT_117680 [Aspergillus ellipticus CBS 707.79]
MWLSAARRTGFQPGASWAQFSDETRVIYGSYAWLLRRRGRCSGVAGSGGAGSRRGCLALSCLVLSCLVLSCLHTVICCVAHLPYLLLSGSLSCAVYLPTLNLLAYILDHTCLRRRGTVQP